MGDKVEPRRDYISEHADFNRPDDFDTELDGHSHQAGHIGAAEGGAD